MKLNLIRPICFFDLETTGVNITKDRIVEISLLKVFPDNREQKKTWLINPEISISSDATAIHGISNEDVVDAPTFKMVARQVNEFIKDP